MPQSTTAQLDAKNAALRTYLNNVLGGGLTFSMTDTQTKQVFEDLVTTAKDAVSSSISTPSVEQIILISLYHNGGGLFGAKLQAAIASDNRAEAWYQIRYGHANELWDRRYAESALFGLYGSGSTSAEDARKIYRMFTANRLDMINTDAAHASQISNNAYGISVPALNDATGLGTAKTVLLDSLQTQYGDELTPASFIGGIAATNILLDPENGKLAVLNSSNESGSHLLIGGNNARSLIGGADADVLIGDAEGSSNLNGGGGADILIGGEGSDFLNGGGGNGDIVFGNGGDDVLTAGGGSATLIGGAGNDAYFYDSATAGAAGLVVIDDYDGSVYYDGKALSGGKRGDPGTEYADDAGNQYAWDGGDLMVNGRVGIASFRNGDLGIVLTDQDGDPDPDPDPANNGSGGSQGSNRPRDPRRQGQSGGWPFPSSPLLGDLGNALLHHGNAGAESLWERFLRALSTGILPCPIVLDLNGDGVQTTVVNSGANFDHDANGFAESTGWVNKDDGLLVWDRNGNGRIDSGRELFGNQTQLSGGGLAANGFLALAELDANGDGVVDANDAGFANLKVWMDANGDGYSDASELLSLAAAGVASINTAFTASTGVDSAGNEHRQIGSFTRSDGSTGAAEDIWFKSNPANAIAESSVAVSSGIEALPDIQGHGQVYDLHQAMARDATGQLQQLVQSFQSESSIQTRTTLFEQILFKWAGVDSISSTSRGSYIDARKLAVLERFMGRSFVGSNGSANPVASVAPILTETYRQLFEMLYAQLMTQTHLAGLYDSLHFNLDTQSQTMTTDISAVLSVLSTEYATNQAAALDKLQEFLRTAKGLDGLSSMNFSGLAIPAEFIDAQGFLRGGPAIGIYIAGAGNDTITSASMPSTILGLDGNDTITYNSGTSNVVDGGDGNDIIKSSDTTSANTSVSSNVLRGGLGNDSFDSGGTADTYIFNRGDGQDTIKDYGGALVGSLTLGVSFPAGADKIAFGPGIAPGDVVASSVGANLLLRVNDPDNPSSTDQITMENWSNADYRIEQITFADGTAWTAVQLSSMAMNGTDGDDTITVWDDATLADGGAGNDTIADSGTLAVTLRGGDGNDTINFSYQANSTIEGGDGDDLITNGASVYVPSIIINTFTGGAGNDRIVSSGGTDTYVFNRGNGQDSIYDSGYYVWGGAGADKIVFGAGIAAGDIFASRVGYNLVLKVNDPNNSAATDQVTVENWFTNDQYRIETLVFVDGTTLTKAQLTATGNVLYGTSGADTLTGWSDDSSIFGLDGNDIITDSSGSDTIDGGAGDDVITDSGTGTNTLRGGDGNDTINFSYQAGNTIEGGAGDDLISDGPR